MGLSWDLHEGICVKCSEHCLAHCHGLNISCSKLSIVRTLGLGLQQTQVLKKRPLLSSGTRPFEARKPSPQPIPSSSAAAWPSLAPSPSRIFSFTHQAFTDTDSALGLHWLHGPTDFKGQFGITPEKRAGTSRQGLAWSPRWTRCFVSIHFTPSSQLLRAVIFHV